MLLVLKPEMQLGMQLDFYRLLTLSVSPAGSVVWLAVCHHVFFLNLAHVLLDKTELLNMLH